MKKMLIVVICLVFCFTISGCGRNKQIGKHVYTTYGLFNSGTERNPNIEYEVILGNVVWAVILSETIIVPLYVIGWSLYEPIRYKTQNDELNGVIK